ncbi:MAG: hypothetical protein P0Y65_00095 [Candidatus Devosia phytovorans]|uniref:Uncharacterized protein n=1 Tax=Candidatus Devosia phytovorans TaxID=3121372 RepID=A0AAJ5VV76_9HYPH|nr:hypothetical protein [Devosia sp.]WEK04696.1 MAG: hypothetical protein P0Y65_00095 [Devosia sp.]
MPKAKWRFLDMVKQDLLAGKRTGPAAMILADRIEAAAAVSDVASLHEVNAELTALIDKLLPHVPAQVLAVLRDGDMVMEAPLLWAYELGQLGFAQSIAARAADRRAPMQVQHAFENPRYVPYIDALYRSDKTGIELSDAVSQTTENVSRVLIDLRGLGLSDFRQEGTRRINFLTSMARAAYRDVGEQRRKIRLEGMTPAGRERLEEKREELPEHMQHAPTFASIQ